MSPRAAAKAGRDVQLDMHSALAEMKDEASEQFEAMGEYLQQLSDRAPKAAVQQFLDTVHRICPLVDEANLMTQEMREADQIAFRLQVLTNPFDLAHDVPEVVVCVLHKATVRQKLRSAVKRILGVGFNMTHDGVDLLYTWSLEKFLQRLELIRDLYEEAEAAQDYFEEVRRRLLEFPHMDPWLEVSPGELAMMVPEHLSSSSAASSRFPNSGSREAQAAQLALQAAKGGGFARVVAQVIHHDDEDEESAPGSPRSPRREGLPDAAPEAVLAELAKLRKENEANVERVAGLERDQKRLTQERDALAGALKEERQASVVWQEDLAGALKEQRDELAGALKEPPPTSPGTLGNGRPRSEQWTGVSGGWSPSMRKEVETELSALREASKQGAEWRLQLEEDLLKAREAVREVEEMRRVAAARRVAIALVSQGRS